jgi:tetratricopeptide (TPR) repeat protein
VAQYAERLSTLSQKAERRRRMAELRNRLENALAGRYAIGREIGRGGMAIVYLARDVRHDRDVALKVLRPELAATLGSDRFLQEIKLAAGLAHPHIMPLHDSGEADGCLYYVMPYVPGESLRDELEARGQLPLVEALEIAREIADALDYAHRNGVVHRDIKPENILLQDGHAEVSDFGIARAISKAGERQTGVGIAVGTPDYMSPEQAAGLRDIDGRSDLYSLGCVLFEMLAGRPPLAITPPEGSGAGPLVPRDRLAELTALRPSVPAEVAGVVSRLLAERPGDRFATAAEVVEALRAPGDVWTPRSVIARRRRRAGFSVAAVALGALAVFVLPKVFGAGLDNSLYLVASFEHGGRAGSALLDGDRCELLLHSAFTRWEGVTIIGQPRVNDSRARDDFRPTTLERGLAMARGFGSGWLVWGQVWHFKESNVVRAGLYDVRRGRAVREVTVRVAIDLSDADAKFTQIADSLLHGVATLPPSRTGPINTRNLPAFQAYAQGQGALTKWDLDSATRAFTRALLADPQFPQAALWLAQVEQWAGRPVNSWRRAAAAAAAAGDRLAAQERLMATGLASLADRHYQEACAAYWQMVSRDSTDYVGWYGLGECRIQDSLVIRDPASPSQWSFRSSYGAAADAYARALRLVPSTSIAFGDTAFNRLSRLLFTERTAFRQGYAVSNDTTRFGAFPSWIHDTLAFTPYPLDEALGWRRYPATSAEAVRHNQIRLRSVTDAWLEAFPASPAVLETHALVLETSGAVQLSGSPRRSALDAVREARRLTRDSVQALRLAVAEARLLLKLGDYRGTRRIVDSVLSTVRHPSPALAALLVGPALLVGRVDASAALAPIGFADSVLDFRLREPEAVMTPAWALLAYSSVGRPRDSIIALRQRVSTAIDNYVAPARRESARATTLDGPAVLAFPDMGLTERHRAGAQRLALLHLQLEQARGNLQPLRAELDSLWTASREWRTSVETTDGAYLDAMLFASAGDTAHAVEVLDAALGAPLNLDTETLAWITLPGNLVRAMILRARLAAAQGDANHAAQWASAVVTLWSNADAEFLSVVDSMRVLSDSRHPRE